MAECHDPLITGSNRIGWIATCCCGHQTTAYTTPGGAAMAFGEHLRTKVRPTASEPLPADRAEGE